MNSPISRDLSSNNAAEAESAIIEAEEEDEFGPIDENDDTDDSDSLFEFVRVSSTKNFESIFDPSLISYFFSNQDIWW